MNLSPTPMVSISHPQLPISLQVFTPLPFPPSAWLPQARIPLRALPGAVLLFSDEFPEGALVSAT
jgi:hypothetical protein